MSVGWYTSVCVCVLSVGRVRMDECHRTSGDLGRHESPPVERCRTSGAPEGGTGEVTSAQPWSYSSYT